MPRFSFSLACVIALATSATALRAVPGQQCAEACADVIGTKSSDIVCSDADLDSTVPGRKFQNCLSCQQNSTANDPNTGESDLRWFIYNLRFAMSTCLWGYGNTTVTLSTPCITNPACGLYQSSVEFNALLPNASTFDYCTTFDSLAQNQEAKCLTCLQQVQEDYYISNYFTALVAGCRQRPNPGSTLSLSGSLFSKTAINITTPMSTAIPVYTSQPSGGLSLGGIVGVAIAALVLVITGLGCCIVFCGKRRRRTQLERLHTREMYVSESRMSVAPVDAKWGHHGGDSWSPDDVATVDGWGNEDKTFSPYESRYNSPVSARDVLNPKQLWESHEPSMSGFKASPTTKEEAIEMEKVQRKNKENGQKLERQIVADFVEDAAMKGFTTAPIIRAPDTSKGKNRAWP